MSTTQVSGLLRPPADVFFETTVQLGPLTEEEARELLRRRLDEPDSRASKELISIAADIAVATPRRLLEVARELGAEPAVGGSRLNTGRGLKAREAAVARLTRPARMLAHELEAIGWASASDERLLSRMGWTRPRVIQVIAELQSGGLVQMREENTGRGRPRKLYRLTPASDFIDPISEPRAGGPS
jgi:predicted transcriptional regulator